MRRLLALALVSGTLVAATATPATAACAQPNATPEQQAKRADVVFTGTIGARSASARTVSYDVEVDQVFKGEIGTQTMVETPRAPQACGLPDLSADRAYLWYVTADGETLTATRDGGTAPATPTRVRQVERLLGPGIAPVPPPATEATFETVADEQAELSRIAAPGLALVLVGLLGLLLVGALGRRRG